MAKYRILLDKKTGRKFFVKNIQEDYHCQFGFIAKKDLKKLSGTVMTNTGKELAITVPLFIDLYRKIKRGPQIISMKDMGLVVSETGINKNSVVLDSGTGSGACALFLANCAKKVVSYELRPDFHEIAKKNQEFLGMKNLILKQKDIYEGIDEKNFDLIMLDLSEPWKVIESASKALKSGGFIVSYSPSIYQAGDFADAIIENSDFALIKTSELLERNWETEKRKLRPKSRMIGHTGFLVFARKM